MITLDTLDEIFSLKFQNEVFNYYSFNSDDCWMLRHSKKN